MLSFFMAIAKWLQSTWWALDISGSTWAYPFVQATHFTGLSLWIGTNLSLDFRLLGIGKKRRPRRNFPMLFSGGIGSDFDRVHRRIHALLQRRDEVHSQSRV